jgi:hypothetical protein
VKYVKKIAEHTPIGAAIKIAINDINKVPDTRGNIPNNFFISPLTMVKFGSHIVPKKNSIGETRLKKAIVWVTKERTIIMVIDEVVNKEK